jgi:phage repressor protein C with HTH and peptisase S24 domain
MSDDVRSALAQVAREKGESLASLSRLLGRNAAYLQQFVTRGSPARLDERDRQTLAQYLRVDDEMLGGPPRQTSNDDMVAVPRLSVEASAGPGRHVGSELSIGTFRFDRAWLRPLTSARPEQLSIISVAGDSMSPTLASGDDVLVDGSDAGRRVRDGIYVLRRDDTLMIKRLALSPAAGTVTISSDNPAYPTWPDCRISSINLIGRVIWVGRQLG